MGLLNLFKKKQKYKDDFFGELEYIAYKDKTKNFYSGRVDFYSDKIGVTIDADENGPSDVQRDFFIQFRDNYTLIWKNIIDPFLKKELEDWLSDNPIKNFEGEFLMDGISIPSITGDPIDWELTYYCKPIKHWVTIYFIDMVPQEGVAVDG